MRKRIRILLLASILVSLGVVIYKVAENVWLLKLREIKQDPTKLLDFVPEAALQLKEFRRSKIEQGRKVWEITGDEAVYLKAENEAVIKRPRLIFYQENGETMEVNGDEGRILFTDQELEEIQLQGAVEASYRGFVLKTHEIVYLRNNNQVISRGKVTLSGEGLELEGVGMEFSLPDDKIRLQDSVRTRIEPDRLGSERVWSKRLK